MSRARSVFVTAPEFYKAVSHLEYGQWVRWTRRFLNSETTKSGIGVVVTIWPAEDTPCVSVWADGDLGGTRLVYLLPEMGDEVEEMFP